MPEITITIDNLIRIPLPLSDPLISEIKERFTARNPLYAVQLAMAFGNAAKVNVPEIIISYFENEHFIMIPRGTGRYARVILNKYGYDININDQRVQSSNLIKFYPRSGWELRPHQKEAREVLSGFEQGVLESPCGGGKSLSFLMEIAARRQPTIIIVHKRDLVKQWMNEINNKFYLEEGTIGTVAEGVFNPQPTITIGMVQTMIRLTGPQWAVLQKTFGMVMVDESHHVPSETFLYVVNKFPARFRLACSVGGDSVCEFKGGVFGLGQVISIEYAFDFLLDKGYKPEIKCDKTYEQFYEIIKVKDVYSRGWVGKQFGWKLVKSFIRHKSDRQLYKLRVGGDSLTLTEDHSLYTIYAKEFVIVHSKKKGIATLGLELTKNIKKNDIVLVDNGNSWNAPSKDIINMLEIPGVNTCFVYFDVTSIDRCIINKLTNDDYKAVYRYRSKGYLPVFLFKELICNYINNVPTNYLSWEGAHGNRIDVFIDLCKLAYLFGLWLGNGWLDSRVCISMPGTKIQRTQNYLKRINCYKANVGVAQKVGSSELRISNRGLFLLFKYLFGDCSAPTKYIPGRFIIVWAEEARRELLQGLIDTDGSLSKRDKSVGYYCYTTVSVWLAKTLLSLLRSLNIQGYISESEPRKGGIIDGRRIIGKHKQYNVRWSKCALEEMNEGHCGNRSRFIHKDLFFNEGVIREKRKVNYVTNKYVYDLEMKGHPSFVSNGILVHNTATPRRKDQLEFLLFDFIGPILYRIPDATLEAQGITMTAQVQRVITNYFYNYTGPHCWSHMITAMTKDEDRNVLILSNIIEDVKQGRLVLVLSERKNHCKFIAHQLSKYNIATRLLIGEKSGEEREIARQEALRKEINVLVGTPMPAEEGMDIPNLNSIHLTCPSNNESKLKQRVGRVKRAEIGKELPIVYDYVDHNIDKCCKVWWNREKWYRKWKFELLYQLPPA